MAKKYEKQLSKVQKARENYLYKSAVRFLLIFFLYLTGQLPVYHPM